MSKNEGSAQLELFASQDEKELSLSAPEHKDERHSSEANTLTDLRHCLPEVLRGEDEAVIEEYVRILYFILVRWERDLRAAKQKLKEASAQDRPAILDVIAKLEKFSGRIPVKKVEREIREIKKYHGPDDRSELLERLESLRLIEIVREGAKGKPRITWDVRLPLSISLEQAQKIKSAYRGIYPRRYRQLVTDAPITLISHVAGTLKRSGEIIRPHDAEETPQWAFHVPKCFNDALDIHLVSRKLNTVEYTTWTQGVNFAFKDGDTLYRNAESWEHGRPVAIQVKSGVAACGTQTEGLNRGADFEQKPDGAENKVKGYFPGRVEYKDCETGETKTVTQMQFVRMLIGD